MLLRPYNVNRFQILPPSRRQQFLEIEQHALVPLLPTRYQLRSYNRAKVQKISHIYLGVDKNYYSVPHRYVGRHVEVQYTAGLVEIFYDGERIAHHKRSRKAGAYTTIGTHMTSTHQTYNDWNHDSFPKRA